MVLKDDTKLEIPKIEYDFIRKQNTFSFYTTNWQTVTRIVTAAAHEKRTKTPTTFFVTVGVQMVHKHH
jgi:hypothetical protein